MGWQARSQVPQTPRVSCRLNGFGEGEGNDDSEPFFRGICEDPGRSLMRNERRWALTKCREPADLRLWFKSEERDREKD